MPELGSIVDGLVMTRLGAGDGSQHVNRVFRKLALRDRVHAVLFAYETGLVQPGESREPRFNTATPLGLPSAVTSWPLPRSLS